MPLIRSPLWNDPRVKPPFGAVEVDSSHPLAGGLKAALLYNEGGQMLVDVATGLQAWADRAGYAAWLPAALGPSLAGYGIADGSHTLWVFGGGVWPSTAGVVPHSWFFISRVVADSSSAWQLLDVGGPNQPWMRIGTSGTNWKWTRPTVWDDLSPFSFATGWHAVGISPPDTDGSTGRFLLFWDRNYDQGTVQSATTTPFASAAATGGTCRATLRSYAVSPSNVDQLVLVYYWAGRQIRAAEYQWLSDEPYTLLRPRVRRRYWTTAAAATERHQTRHLLTPVGFY